MTTLHAERGGADQPTPVGQATELGGAIELYIRTAPNNAFLQARLPSLGDPGRLLRFLHRFLVFNDALAARVPYLAGLIHLTPDVFIDHDAPPGFLSQTNARIAAHVAAAANDEYQMAPGRDMVHQRLSQVFFKGALAYFQPTDAWDFERRHPIPPSIAALLAEARSKFFIAPQADDLFAALGFHVGLEFFANEEFNLVDRYLSTAHPGLVTALQRGGDDVCDYTWLALHTEVEIGHYRAGLAAVREAVIAYRDPDGSACMAETILDGLRAFADLQRRFYQAVFAEVT